MYPTYIPAKDADFANWLLNFSTLLTAAPVTYGLTAPDATAVAAQETAFSAAYALAIDPGTRTAATVAAKDAARAAAEAVVRPYAVQISLDAGVLPADKVAIGVTLRSTTPTPIPAPTTAPVLGIVSQIAGRATISYRDASLPSGKAKPFGAIGMEVYVTLGTAPSVSPDSAQYRGTITKSPNGLTFGPTDSGKTATVWGRWVTRSGPAGTAQVGPWSAALSFVVM